MWSIPFRRVLWFHFSINSLCQKFSHFWQKKSYLPTQEGGVTRGLAMARRGQSSLRHDHAHSQVSAPVLPAPQFTLSLLESAHCRHVSGPLFNTHHSRSRGRLLATYLLTYRAPGRREKATYLLFGTTGIELRSSKNWHTSGSGEKKNSLTSGKKYPLLTAKTQNGAVAGTRRHGDGRHARRVDGL